MTEIQTLLNSPAEHFDAHGLPCVGGARIKVSPVLHRLESGCQSSGRREPRYPSPRGSTENMPPRSPYSSQNRSHLGARPLSSKDDYRATSSDSSPNKTDINANELPPAKVYEDRDVVEQAHQRPMSVEILPEANCTAEDTRWKGGSRQVEQRSVAQLIAAGTEVAMTVEWTQLVSRKVEEIVDAHMRTCNYTADKVAAGIKKYEANNNGNTPATHASPFPSSNGQGTPDPKKMWATFVENMTPVIKRIASFCKLLPGFRELDYEDQLQLFKQGSFEAILIRYTPLFTKKGMFVPGMTARIPRHKLPLMPMGDFFEEQFKFADVVNELGLNDTEIGLLAAVMIMNPDRKGLTNILAVQELQKLFLQGLHSCMKSSNPECHNEKFTHTLNLLPLSAVVNELHLKRVSHMRAMAPDLPFPDLHRQVYDV